MSDKQTAFQKLIAAITQDNGVRDLGPGLGWTQNDTVRFIWCALGIVAFAALMYHNG